MLAQCRRASQQADETNLIDVAVLADVGSNAANALVVDGGQQGTATGWLSEQLGMDLDGMDTYVPPADEQAVYDTVASTVAGTMASVNFNPDVEYPGAVPQDRMQRLKAAVQAGTVDLARARTIARSWREEMSPGYNAAFQRVSKRNPFVFFKKPDVSAYDAIQSFVTGFTVAECYTMAAATELWALANAMGAEAFNHHYAQWAARPGNERKPFLKGVVEDTFLGEYVVSVGKTVPTSGPDTDYAEVEAQGGTFQVRVGDKAYFKNHQDLKKKHPNSPWGGENVVCSDIVARKGKKVALWSGFGPFVDASADEILDALYHHYAEPSTSDFSAPEYKDKAEFLADPRGARLLIQSRSDGFRLDTRKILEDCRAYANR